MSSCIIEADAHVVGIAKTLEQQGVKAMDALHIACAASSRCNYFITTYVRLLSIKVDGMMVVSPIRFIDLEG
jgi:hypothetical protein